MNDILKLARIQILLILLFAISKHWIRPFVLEREYRIAFDIIVLSLPNFFEGMIGVLTLTYLGLYLNNRYGDSGKQLKPNHLYLIATLLSAIYVLTQEFKLNNLGGNNVYDPYDVLFSIIGLLVGFLIVWKLQPTIQA